ncbi:hypothetical protein MLD38_039024 [Melastoma candidum]|uniref:Uncharacterized protein n=1 Tax=Melastoma candidum TaxID=119954 RepID=A0ACB9L1I7_9MYRT|nr:hypothetical protein MLD38_039024 [Melastoma candidum]
MSTSPPPPPPPPPPSPSSPSPNYLTNLGLGYAIAISLGFLVLLSSLLLSSYVCCHRRRHRHRPPYPYPNSLPTASLSPDGGVIVPRIIFVAEEEDEDSNSPSPVVGLDSRVISSYPKFPFVRGTWEDDATTCSVCLCEYREGEMLRMMPECRHCFHLSCLDPWLKLNGSCPVCRNSPLPTPISTPLQEIVPLSQYADNRRHNNNRRRFPLIRSGEVSHDAIEF